MKYYLTNLAVSCCLAFSNISALHGEEPTVASQEQKAEELYWFTDYEKAKALAKEQSKPLFLYFTGSDWCSWCKKTDREILSTKEFRQAIGDKLIFVKIDSPMSFKLDPEVEKQNQALSKEFKIRGVPTIILLSPDLHIIGKLGYQSGGGRAFATQVQKLLDEYSKRKPEVNPAL
jgi:protein disulfide-isomerase